MIISQIRGESRRSAGSPWLTALTLMLSFMALADNAAAQGPSAKMAPLAIELSNRTLTIVPGAGPHGPIATVKLADQSFTVPMGSVIEAWHGSSDPKAATHSEGEYLFIDSYNGGNGWRSQKRNIFAIRNGELVRLGDIASDIDGVPPELKRQLHDAQRFLDVDDQLETNRLTSHAGAPSILVALNEQDGKLTYDPAWCWRLNAAEYKNQADRLAATALAPASSATAEAWLSVAVIDKYCSRVAQLRHDLNGAGASLPSGDYHTLLSLIDKLHAGRRPDH
jgi:hypothetical protein